VSTESWELQIFKEPMTTAAAIDRVVHHSVVLELGACPSNGSDDLLVCDATR